MKNMKTRIAAFGLASVMTLGMAGSTLAYTTSDFTDVPAGNWAYAPVMKMADAGVIVGTGNGSFSPDMKLSAAMFLTTVGRALYAGDVKTVDGDKWFTAYVRTATEKGLLTGTAITTENVEGEITRYDMAVILERCAKNIIKAPAATADTGKIKDYGDIPTKYADVVAQVYAYGLIAGDGQGNFNGTATMRRDEAATVMDRLIQLKTTTEVNASKPVEPETPRTGEMVTFTVEGSINCFTAFGEEIYIPSAAIKFCYKDGRVLAEGVSGADGKFKLTVTVDEADYKRTGSVYYLEARGTDATGKEFWNDSHATNSLYSTQPWLVGSGWNITLHDF